MLPVILCLRTARPVLAALPVLLLFLESSAHAATPSQFGTVEALMHGFKDFTREAGTFRVIRKTPLHIQVSPVVVAGDLPEVIDAQVKRAVIYGIYRSFIHTPVTAITVTAIPLEKNFRTGTARVLPAYKRTVTATKDRALALAQRHLRVSSLRELVTDERIGGELLSDQWTKGFQRLYYDTLGPPGLTLFYSELER